MWKETDASIAPSASITVVPKNVIFEFDGPQIFYAYFGFIEAVFAKIDDQETSCLWLVAQTDEHILQKVAEERISVRCAFLRENVWVIRTDYDLEVKEFWACHIDDIAEEHLPAPGISIGGKKNVADSIEQAEAFFSIRFAGQNISASGGMSFSLYRNLIDGAHDATRRILGIRSLVNSRKSMIDYNVRQAAGSLIIAIDRPTYNVTESLKRINDPNFGQADLDAAFAHQRDLFLNDVAVLVDGAVKGTLVRNGGEDDYRLLDAIHSIIPTGDNDLSSVTFSSGSSSTYKNVVINEEVGQAITKAYKESSFRSTEMVGKIEIINSRQSSFVLLSQSSGRQITCYVPRDIFEEISEDEEFRNGTLMIVSGDFWTRSRRDAISVTGLPRIVRAADSV